jgi:hypothetical protein
VILPRPVGELPLWEAVMERAGHRCQCTGACGSRHSRSQGRCDHAHGGAATRHSGLLLAAPVHAAELSLAPHYAAALPAARLAAWCPACHDAARRHQPDPEENLGEDAAPPLF